MYMNITMFAIDVTDEPGDWKRRRIKKVIAKKSISSGVSIHVSITKFTRKNTHLFDEM